jgi:VanZ family protein
VLSRKIGEGLQRPFPGPGNRLGRSWNSRGEHCASCGSPSVVFRLSSRSMSTQLLKAVCAAVLCIILMLGLWPFHAPRNDVSWLGTRNGLHFGRYGTVFSSSEFTMTAAQNNPGAGSLEIWLQPGRIWDFSTFLAFYTPGNPLQFSLRQAQPSLLLQTAIQDGQKHTAVKDLYVESVFRKTVPTFITVTSGTLGTAVYIDGAIAKRAPQIRISTQEFDGRLVLGDSAEQADSWSGQLLGLSIYNRELTTPQVHEHYESWTQMGRPQIAADEGNAALYLFDERTGRVIHSKGGSGADLCIPKKYDVLGQVFLEDPWSEFRRSQGYWSAIVKNVVGFIPFGCCFYVYFALVRQTKRATLATVIVGFAVSLTIEVLQALLPTRASGTTDLITNTLGTYLGVLSYKAVSPTSEKGLRWWPFVESPRQ